MPLSHDDAVTAARRLAERLAPGAAQRDRDGADAVPSEALDLLDSSGLLALTVPVADGGPGLGPRTLAEVTRVLAAADPSIAQVPQAHYLMVDLLAVHGRPEIRERLFAEVLDGRRIGNALAERGGTHAQDLRTRIVAGRMNGVKYYTTGALTSSWIAVTAIGESGRPVLAFVPRGARGVQIGRDWDAVGQRATISGTATFTDVEVELWFDYATVYQVPQQFGARAQLVHAAIDVGIARGALDDTRDYLREHARPSSEAVRYGVRRVVDDPHVLHRYGRLATRVRAAEALLAEAAGTLEEVGLVPATAQDATRGSLAVAAAKAFAGEVAVDAGSELFALCGTSAVDRRHDLDRHWRNARTHTVHDPLDWKYHHLAAYELGDVWPPNHGQL